MSTRNADRYKYLKKRKADYKVEQRLNKVVPISEWSVEKFRLVARDRGFQTEQALVYAVSKQLACSLRAARLLIQTGRFSWGQVLALGSMLEMTPKEFCDVFLYGYFKESEVGTFRAYVEDVSPLLQPPIKILPKKEDE